MCQVGGGGWSPSLEAFTEPGPGLEPPGLLGKKDLVPVLLHFLAGRRPGGAVELSVFGQSESLAS